MNAEVVKELFEYDDGKLKWKVRKALCVKVGRCVGCLNRSGYLVVSIEKRQYLVHRLIFLWVHGYLPRMIDHRDGDPLNNRIENLRECSAQENGRNRKKSRKKSSDFKGVVWVSSAKRWRSQIYVDNKLISLGYFNDEVIAAKAYNDRAKELFGDYARLNDVNVA